MTEYLVLAAAAFFAGVLNTIAGGGTFLTFPALVYTGVPLVAANATSAVAVFPGYLGGAIGFRREIEAFDLPRLLRIVVFTAIGGLIGSLLLLVSSNEAFAFVVPFLLMLATVAFAFGPRIQGWASRHSFGKAERPWGTLLVSVYGGYFNGGLGIVLPGAFLPVGYARHQRDERAEERAVLRAFRDFSRHFRGGGHRRMAPGGPDDGGGHDGRLCRRPCRKSPSGVDGESRGHRGRRHDEYRVLLEARGMNGLTACRRTTIRRLWRRGRAVLARPCPFRNANAALLQVSARRSPTLSTQPEPFSPWVA